MSRLIMIAFVILVVCGAVLATTGVLSVRNTKDATGVTIDKKELKEKSQDAVKKTEDAGGKVLDKTGEALRKAADEVRGPSHSKTTATPTVDDKDKNLRPPEGSKELPQSKQQSDR